MPSRPIVVIVVSLAVAVAVLQGQPSPVFRTLERGIQSGIGDARQVTIRSATEWQDLWAEHSPTRERPTVDWGQEIVVGLFVGRRSTGGFGIEILGIEARAKTLTVRYRKTQPARGGVTTQVLTSPFHLVAVQAWAEEVAFQAVP